MNLDAPNIVVPAQCERSLAAIYSSTVEAQVWDIVELRLDQFSPQPSASEIPLLVTPRHPDEGGAKHFSTPAARIEATMPWLPHASAMDLEIAHAAELTDLARAAKDSEVLLVLSFHDFQTTPDRESLTEVVKRGIDAGADVVKLATTTETAGDVTRLLELFERFPQQRLSVMGMGKLGMASRLIAAACGSVLNYAAVGEATVPGQWPAEEFHRLLEQTGARK
jgi:3-dehydroquinate dehydratase-1